MKHIIFGLCLLLSSGLTQAQTPNYYRNPDKIYLDSKEGHNGSFTWQMHKADETKDPAEKSHNQAIRPDNGCRQSFREQS